MRKLLVAGAGAAMAFGITAASASALNLGSSGGGLVVQQSNAVRASCATGNVAVSLDVTGTQVLTATVQGAAIQTCAGSEIQLVVYDGANHVLGWTDTPRIHADGGDLQLQFNNALDPQRIEATRVTIADNIVSPPGP